MLTRSALVLLVAAGLAGLPSRAPGQAVPTGHPRREIPGHDFHRDGVWRKRARQVAAHRAAMLARGQFSALNAPLLARGAPSLAAVMGTFRVPAILFKFKDTPDPGPARDTAAYNAVLFATTPPLGRPYTYRSFYQELSNGLLDIQGQTYGYAALDSNEVTYTGVPPCPENPYGTTCNGLFSNDAYLRMQNGLREALAKLDNSVDWTQYDSDGDGYVDLVVFIQPAVDGACVAANNNHLWSHRDQLGSGYATHSPAPGGGFEKVRDYILQSGVGGSDACTSTQIMPIGTVAHETGHGFGLPDLYDTQGSSEGIGDWGLMGAGNYTSPFSPSRMEAWSLNELGWVTLAPLTTPGTYSFDAAPVSHTAFYVRVRGGNPRGEYFLLENRQASQSDSAMIRIRCQRSALPANCPGGLLIWHVDSAQVVNGEAMNNTVNYGAIHGLALMQADGLGDLDAGRNRGDAGDQYPGKSGNTVFSYSTNPAAVENANGAFVGFAVDSIRQLVPNGTMQFRLRFGGLTLVRATDTTLTVSVDATAYHVFRDFLDSGSVHTISIADTQFTNGGRTRDIFASWSNGKTTAQIVDTAGANADTLIAAVTQAFQLTYGADASHHGRVTANPSSDSSGHYLAPGTSITLTATPDSGYVFAGWTGDTSAGSAALTLTMTRPYSVTANFGMALSITSPHALPGAVMGTAYLDTLRAVGGTGAYTWQLVGQAPPSLALSPSGVITGIPSQLGTFSLQAKVTSASLQQTDTFTVTTTAPTLATAAVVARLLSGSGLTTGDLTYLDLIGNQNGGFDLGDFLAWVKATGAP